MKPYVVDQFHSKAEDGEARKKGINEKGMLAKVSTEWAAMSREEQEQVTEVRWREMLDEHEAGRTAQHNMAINVYNNANKSLKHFEDEVSLCTSPGSSDWQCQSQLCEFWMQTGVEILMIAVRTNQEHPICPYVLETSPRVSEYFQVCFNTLPTQWATKLEGHCISVGSEYFISA